MSFSLKKIASQHRQPQWEIHELFYQRWSPRAMSGEPIKKEELMALFEAARWAPSSQKTCRPKKNLPIVSH